MPRSQKALADSAAELPVLKEQMEKEGVAGITDAKWREHQRRIRMETARTGMTGALREMGSAVNTYFTPEERLAFAHFAESKRNGMNTGRPRERSRFRSPRAPHLPTRKRTGDSSLMMQQAALPNFYSNVQPLYRSAATSWSLRRTWPRRWSSSPTKCHRRSEAQPLLAAADAYRSAATSKTNFASLSQFLRTVASTQSARSVTSKLLLARQPQELVQYAVELA